jgi:DNA-binding helix-hairpin-helix protein with protein kinase domain
LVNRYQHDAGNTGQPTQDLPPLEFEFVDFDAAQRALAEPPPGVQPLHEIDWLQRRGLPMPEDQAATADALLWFAQLPAGFRPQALLDHYPRLINRIAQSWPSRVLSLEVLDDLLIDRRGGRAGFARQVSEEVIRLRELRASQA